MDDLDQVISANRQDADAYFARGHAFDSLENFEAAIEDFDRVLLLRSGDTSTLYTSRVSAKWVLQYVSARRGPPVSPSPQSSPIGRGLR